MNKRLEEFLAKHNARCLRIIKDGDGSDLFEAYLINGQVVILQIFSKGGGFQFYVQASRKNDIDAEFAAVEEAIK